MLDVAPLLPMLQSFTNQFADELKGEFHSPAGEGHGLVFVGMLLFVASDPGHDQQQLLKFFQFVVLFGGQQIVSRPGRIVVGALRRYAPRV